MDEVIALAQKHATTWRDKPESYWFARLVQEVGELGSSLVGDHDDTPDWELQQIAAICLNWLEMRNGHFHKQTVVLLSVENPHSRE